MNFFQAAAATAGYAPNLAENRRFVRRAVELWVELGNARKKFETHPLTDLSLGGLGVETPADFHVGDRLKFRVPLPNGKNVTGTAKVRWHEARGFKSGYGLQIEAISFISKQHLGQFLSPGRVGALKATDLILQFLAAVVLIGVFRELVSWNAVANVLVAEDFPFFMLAGAGSLVAWLLWIQVKY